MDGNKPYAVVSHRTLSQLHIDRTHTPRAQPISRPISHTQYFIVFFNPSTNWAIQKIGFRFFRPAASHPALLDFVSSCQPNRNCSGAETPTPPAHLGLNLVLTKNLPCLRCGKNLRPVAYNPLSADISRTALRNLDFETPNSLRRQSSRLQIATPV